MEIIIQSPHFTLNRELRDYVTAKVDTLGHLYERIEVANVSLTIDNPHSGDNKVCEIRLAIPGNDLFAKKHSNTFEEATVKAVDAMQEQIEKMKTRMSNRL